jgi:predicted ATP-dependent endonuclease of OLD family
MNLKNITIKNFRSIENETFTINEVNGGYTFSLIGINESGKSSFLNAVSLADNEEKIVYPKDFFDEKKPIEIVLNYQIEGCEEKDLRNTLAKKGFGKEILSEIKIKGVEVCAIINPDAEIKKEIFDKITFGKTTFEDYTLQEEKPIKKIFDQEQETFDLEKYFEEYLPKYFWKISHHIIFWKSDSKHLINEQINLDAFASDPEGTSIPLMNCFKLADFEEEDIQALITKLKADPSEINNLQEKLGDKVTAHIKKVWPKHPIKIKFQIINDHIIFLIEDDKVKYKSRTTDQRSDGFRQFISFLLTVSAENANKQLYNSLLLLDEPETHLHPQAQEYLKDELIKITRNGENNVVFFATHSNYMIDKDHMDRCFRVTKQSNKKTIIEKIERDKTSFSEANFEIFGIPSSDYHNELYGYLEDIDKSKLNSLPKNLTWKNKKSGAEETVSLATYIRHSIHHPENDLNDKYTPDDLLKSIEILRKLKYGN